MLKTTNNKGIKGKLLSFPMVLLLVISGGFFLSGCEQGAMEGPELNDLYGPFSIVDSLEASASTVDFASGESVHFTASFSKKVNWTLTLTGETSGSQKVISDFSKALNVDNATWDGTTSELPVFGAENIQVMLTVEGEVDTMYATTSTASTISYDGVLVADFETSFTSGPNSFIQSGAGMMFGRNNSVHAAGEGEYFYTMRGTVEWDWLIGMTEFTADDRAGLPTFPLSANPNDVYFNIMVFGESSRPESRIQFQFREDENENGTFEAGSEDLLSSELFIVNWDGWRLISIPYADLAPEAPGSTSGNGAADSDKIHSITALLLAPKVADSPSGLPNPGTADIDFMIFTTGGPLKP